MKKITSKKINLRKFAKSDSVKLFEWSRDPDLTKYIGPAPSNSPLGEYKRLMNKIQNEGRQVFMIIEAKEKKAIGYIYIDVNKKNNKAELSITIGEKKYHGRGYGTESVKEALNYIFNQLKLNRVFLKVLLFNLPAIKLYKKVGFKKKGLLRQDICLNGEYKNRMIMSILKKEYLTQQKHGNNKNKK